MALNKFKICPGCGRENPPSLLECRWCEADLTGVRVTDAAEAQKAAQPTEAPDTPDVPDVPETPPAGGEQPALVRVCSECGAANPPQARKCGQCGEDISDVLPAPAPCAFPWALESADGTFLAPLDRPACVIGREAALADYLGGKLYVSRQHARLTTRDGRVYIENLSQTNRTFLNNEEIPQGEPAEVRAGDEIGLGGKVIDGARQEMAAYLILRVNV